MSTEEWWVELAALKERVAYLEGRLHERRRTGPATWKNSMDQLREMALTQLRRQLNGWVERCYLSAAEADAIYEHEKQRYEP